MTISTCRDDNEDELKKIFWHEKKRLLFIPKKNNSIFNKEFFFKIFIHRRNEKKNKSNRKETWKGRKRNVLNVGQSSRGCKIDKNNQIRKWRKKILPYKNVMMTTDVEWVEKEKKLHCKFHKSQIIFNLMFRITIFVFEVLLNVILKKKK